MKTYVFSVTTMVTEQWFVEAHSKEEAYDVLFSQGESDENTKEESIKNISFISEED